MNERSKYIRRETIKLMYENGLQHYGGSLSCIEILIALYDHVMTKDDVFLLSKGHRCSSENRNLFIHEILGCANDPFI